jgi:hypothetical protein|tara:strand:- start:772 stop:1176 length:405 start_codon:yes stop_codon:yes gene_type:complete
MRCLGFEIQESLAALCLENIEGVRTALAGSSVAIPKSRCVRSEKLPTLAHPGVDFPLGLQKTKLCAKHRSAQGSERSGFYACLGMRLLKRSNSQVLIDKLIRQPCNVILSNPPHPIQNQRTIRVLPRKRLLLRN